MEYLAHCVFLFISLVLFVKPQFLENALSFSLWFCSNVVCPVKWIFFETSFLLLTYKKDRHFRLRQKFLSFICRNNNQALNVQTLNSNFCLIFYTFEEHRYTRCSKITKNCLENLECFYDLSVSSLFRFR